MNEPLGIFILGNFQGSKLHDLIENFILGEIFIGQNTMLNIENMQLLKPSEVAWFMEIPKGQLHEPF